MLNDQELESEVLELTLAWQQGVADADQRARLEYLLGDSSGARRIYATIASDTVTLADVAEASFGSNPTNSDAGSLVSPAGGFFSGLNRVLLAALAASLLLAVTGVLLWTVGGAAESVGGAANGRQPLARIVQLEDVDWQPGSTVYREWSQVSSGESLKLKSGMVELVVDNAVQVVIKGPAELELVSRHKAIAHSGQLVARAGPEGIGFEIETPNASVVDQGTSFGISITPNDQTDVVVYEGKVDVAVRGAAGTAAARRLETGEALRVGDHGTLRRITTVDASDFLPPPQIGRFASLPSQVITSVTDSVKSLDTAKYYRIVGRGFSEDCHAYVDRLHQWNGVDERGIPAFLRDADYVMTFNDDKVLADLQIAVGFSQPARLFVLWDDRVPVPSWLAGDFVDSGWDVGMDEGFNDRKDGKSRRTAVGPGNGVDFVYSVWRRDVLEASSVILGPVNSEDILLPPREVPQGMYGIAAVPLARAVKLSEQP